MDFQNISPLNVQLNIISGNLFPMTTEDTPFPIIWRIHSYFVCLLNLINVITLIIGCMFVSKQKVLQDGMIYFALCLEVFFTVVRIHTCRKPTQQLIEKLNNILRVKDEMMWNIVKITVKPMEALLRYYFIAGSISVFIWCSTPLPLIFEKSVFFYVDYRMPGAFSKEPFSIGVFILGNIVILLSNMNLFFRKVSVDVYMTHLVLLIAAQYKYISMKLVTIFRNGCLQDDYSNPQEGCSKANWRTENELKILCRHQNAIIHITFMLKDLLSLNFSLIYLNTVFRFCFLGIMLSLMSSMTLLELVLISTYALGALVQFYIMCSCVQKLLDASTEITDKAFHENWYQFGLPIKRTFMLMITSNALECKLSTFERFNISLPSFMSVLNQSYSIALLFKRMED